MHKQQDRICWSHSRQSDYRKLTASPNILSQLDTHVDSFMRSNKTQDHSGKFANALKQFSKKVAKISNMTFFTFSYRQATQREMYLIVNGMEVYKFYKD